MPGTEAEPQLALGVLVPHAMRQRQQPPIPASISTSSMSRGPPGGATGTPQEHDAQTRAGVRLRFRVAVVQVFNHLMYALFALWLRVCARLYGSVVLVCVVV